MTTRGKLPSWRDRGQILNLQQDGPMSEYASKQRLVKRLMAEQGPTTRASSAPWVDWNNMSEILGQPFDTTVIPLHKLEQMRRDPMIAFALMFVKLPIIRAKWYIEGKDAQRNMFVQKSLERIYGRLCLAYCNALDYGFSPMCKRFEEIQPDWMYVDPDVPDAKPEPVWPSKNVKALVWKPFTPLNPRFAIPAWTKSGEFNGIYYNSGRKDYFGGYTANQQPEVPLDWALWATNEKDSVFGSLWGYPRSGYAYRYWWAYWYRFGLADRAFEKWADPPVIAYHPTDVGVDEDGNELDFVKEALALAERLRSGANVALPSELIMSIDEKPTSTRSWELTQMDVKANFDALNQAFEYLDVQKVRAMMVPEQALMEGRGGTSSRNVAGEMGDLLMQTQAVIKTEIDDMINRWMIPQLLEANFGPGGATCRICTKGFDPKDVDTMRTIVQVVGQTDPSKLPVNFRELLMELGIPILSVEHMNAELERQAEAAQATAAALPGQPAPIGLPGTPQPSPAAAPTSGANYSELAMEIEGKRLEVAMKQLELEEKRIQAAGDKMKLMLADMEDQKIKSDSMTMADFAGYLLERFEALETRLADQPTTIQPTIYVDVMPSDVTG